MVFAVAVVFVVAVVDDVGHGNVGWVGKRIARELDLGVVWNVSVGWAVVKSRATGLTPEYYSELVMKAVRSDSWRRSSARSMIGGRLLSVS